ncbi:subtilisin family serine protease [Bacillus mesophilus]|uniref:S8 family serine peptidase n=1 Tax=Bacillus mesophilus TaxID=1808955 RepID=A0A6M0Q7S6_9BACI|nr:S8 family serine peptidase [Bacillus mesophilus]MBM7661743.1 subtilisin family serine protease [Bacillus mesophilus]NEY72401.1 S8 family serine peptidase [Bacillus mesophilus]
MKKYLFKLLCVVLIVGLAMPAAAATQQSEEEILFTVVFKGQSSPKNAEKVISDLGGEIVYSVPEIGVVQVKAPANFAKKAIGSSAVSAANPSLLFQLPEVKSIPLESNEINTEEAYLFDEFQWDIKRLTNNGATFAEHSGSHDVVVGVIDSGIDLNHPDVLTNLLPGSKNFVPPGGVYGVDGSETGDVNDVQDRNGHGTHVAGSIAGNGAMLGVAPNVGHKAYRVFGAEGGAYSAWIMAAIVAAANDGVEVINMSLGGIYAKGQIFYTDPETGERVRLGSDIAEYVAYTRAAKYAESKGALIVAAAGNDAVDASSPKNVTDFANSQYGTLGYEFKGASVFAPASIPNVVTVASTGPKDELALYSNYGAGFIDVAAPGGNYEMYMQYLTEGNFNEYLKERLFEKEFAFSSVPDVKYILNDKEQVIGYEYVSPSYAWNVGTSMAAPKVAAVAALLFDEYEGMTPNKAKVLLKQNAEDIDKTGTDKEFGHGLSTVYSLFE